MEPLFRRISFAFVILCITISAHAQSPDFPHISDIEVEFYQTEVSVTDILQQVTALATEYYDNSVPRGRVDLLVVGNRLTVHYNNDTREILNVDSTVCKATDIEIADDDFYPLFYGWLNKDPLIIGPSAPLWYAQNYRDNIVPLGEAIIRDIKCYAYSLNILGPRENVTVYYYFAADEWTTPYQMKGLKVPIRIGIEGMSSKYSAKEDQWVPINQVTDFAYFRPTITNWLAFQPPVGIGCKDKKSTRTMPKFPDQFMYDAEVTDLLKAADEEVTDIEYHRVWYDNSRMIARLDKYTKMNYISELYDFNTGVTYTNLNFQTCTIKPLRNSFFEAQDGKIIGHLKDPEEVLSLDGKFYYMGKKLIRGIWTDAFESLQEDVVFMSKSLAKLVVTVYFSQDFYKVAVEGETESQIPVFYIVTGWDTSTHIAINLQYNIFRFDDVVWPEMYETFRLGRCFPSMNDKSYFILILSDVSAELAAEMEKADDLILQEIRGQVSKYAKVSDMRLPLINVDYKSSGVYVTGLMLDRPPALKQFWKEFEGEVSVADRYLKVIPLADDKEKCAYSCVDEGDFTCTGFLWCKEACFLKSKDLLDPAGDDKPRNMGESCETWLRATRDSLNNERYLVDALQHLETAVLNGTFTLLLIIDENTEKIIPVSDIVIGDGPFTGEGNQEKPYTTVINFGKLKATDETTEEVAYVDNLNDCYKACKNSESISCASFSYCPDADNKQCRISSVLVVDRKKNPDVTEDDKNCYVYSMKYLDFYQEYPGRVVLISGEDSYKKIASVEECAKKCRDETKFECRGFEYCRSEKTCVLHSKHVLDLKPGEIATSNKKSTCSHYAAKFSADYYDLGYTLIDDDSNKRTELTLEECARACSEEMKANCKSFNYCPASGPYMTDSSCSLSSKQLTDTSVTTTAKDKCHHFEKKKIVDDWAKKNIKNTIIVSDSGYTSKGFTGLVIGMLALGLVLGAIGFVLYSYFRSRSSGEGMTVRFMKSDI